MILTKGAGMLYVGLLALVALISAAAFAAEMVDAWMGKAGW